MILLVDDEADLVDALRYAVGVTLPGYRAIASTSAEEAEATLRELSEDERLSLVCVDHRLGGRTGLELLEVLRRQYPDVPSVLYTGQASASEEARAEAVGAQVLWKPLSLSSWLKQIQKLLEPATL